MNMKKYLFKKQVARWKILRFPLILRKTPKRDEHPSTASWCSCTDHLVSYDREEFHFICQHAKCLNKISVYPLCPGAWILVTL